MISTPPKRTVILRPMAQADLIQVARIEKETFPDPWPLSSFRECIWYGHCCRIIEEQDRVRAYGIMAVAGDTAHILNLCVQQKHRRRGVGRHMLEYLLRRADAARVESIFLEVRISNRPAIRLYESEGFMEIGIRKGYYPGLTGREDALILVRRSTVRPVPLAPASLEASE